MKIGITITGTPLRACGAHGCCERYAAFFSGAKTILNPAAFNMPCSVDSLGFPFYALRWWLRFTLVMSYAPLFCLRVCTFNPAPFGYR